MTRSNDIPVTDAELDQFYGKDVTIHIRHQEAANHVCRAIRELRYLHIESMPEILAALAAALNSSGCSTHDDVQEVIEYLDELHDECEYFIKRRNDE